MIYYYLLLRKQSKNIKYSNNLIKTSKTLWKIPQFSISKYIIIMVDGSVFAILYFREYIKV